MSEHEVAADVPTKVSAALTTPVGGASAEQVTTHGAGGAGLPTVMVKLFEVFDPLALVAIRLTKYGPEKV